MIVRKADGAVVTDGDWELSKGVNIEGLARQRDVNKLAKRIDTLEAGATYNTSYGSFTVESVSTEDR